MSRSLFIWGLIGFGLLQLSCFDGIFSIGECWSPPDETAQTKIQEIIASSDYDKFNILRKTTIDRGNSIIPYNNDLKYFNYSLDGQFATFRSGDRPGGKKVIRYGSSVNNYNRDFGPFLTTDGVISPVNDIVGTIESISLTYSLSHLYDSEAYIRNHIILSENIFNRSVDTLQVGYKPYFTDSMSVRSIYLNDLKFDASGNKLAISATLESDIEWTKILWSSAYYDVTKKIINPSFISINAQNEIDTLFSFPEYTDSLSTPFSFFGLNTYYDFEYRPTLHGIFVKTGGAVHLLDTNLKEISEPLYTGELPSRLSPDGRYVLSRSQLIDLDSKQAYDLTDRFPDYRIGDVSNTKLILINKDYESIIILDNESLEIVAEINLADVPKFPELKHVESEHVYFTEPIFNENDELIFLQIQHSLLFDPHYDCYDK